MDLYEQFQEFKKEQEEKVEELENKIKTLEDEKPKVEEPKLEPQDLDTITGLFKAESSAPSHSPRNFKEQTVHYNSGSDYYIYHNINGTWKKFVPKGITESVWIPAESAKVPGIKPAAYVDHGITGAWEFSDNSEEQVVATFRLPNDLDASQDMTITIGWSSPATSQDCDWEIRYLITAEDEDTGNSTPQETLQSYETSSSTADGLTFSTFTINANQVADGDMCLHLSVFRDGNDGSDTLGDVAHLHGVCLQYTSK